jgi:hypothetical protein
MDINVEDILRVLSKADIINAFPKGRIPRDARRDRATLDEEVRAMPRDELDTLVAVVRNKQSQSAGQAEVIRKRKADGQMERRERQNGASRDLDRSLDHFMGLPSKEQIQQIHRDYRSATSNKALKTSICVSCARETPDADGSLQRLDDLDGIQNLKPKRAHKSHNLVNGLLLLAELVQEDDEMGLHGWFCTECITKLNQDKLPPLALANNMWIGTVPFQLRCLTITESQLIALHYPRMFVFKMYPKDGKHWDRDQLQSGMKGNATSYELNSDDVAKMINGEKMPRRPAILASVIAVAFIGQGTPPKSWLKSTFTVRRQRVRDALIWLKSNNNDYRGIEINDEALGELPEDDVPIEILAAARQDQDYRGLAEECDGYVPVEEAMAVDAAQRDELDDTISLGPTTGA